MAFTGSSHDWNPQAMRFQKKAAQMREQRKALMARRKHTRDLAEASVSAVGTVEACCEVDHRSKSLEECGRDPTPSGAADCVYDSGSC